MNVSNYKNWGLIKYSAALSLLIFFNYFLWSINSWQIIKFINLFIIFFTLIYFFVSSTFKDYWYLKVIILLLTIICLGTPAISIDSWFVYLFSGKVLFYESNLYVHYLDDNYLNVINRPKLPAALSATFAQLLGYWNEIFPKSTNIIIIFPPIIFLISFFKEKILILLWLFLMLFFSGKLFINGMMDGITSLYFVSSVLITYEISITKQQHEKKLLYFVMLLFFMILSLTKDEGTFMILAILFSVIVKDLIYIRKLNYKILVTSVVSLFPIFFWKYIFATTPIKFGAWLLTDDPISRILRIANTENLFNIFFYLITNEKLVISSIIFIFLAFKNFNNNRKLIFFITMNSLIYLTFLIAGMLLAQHDVIATLNASSSRLFIPLVLMLSYFSVFLIKESYPLEKI